MTTSDTRIPLLERLNNELGAPEKVLTLKEKLDLLNSHNGTPEFDKLVDKWLATSDIYSIIALADNADVDIAKCEDTVVERFGIRGATKFASELGDLADIPKLQQFVMSTHIPSNWIAFANSVVEADMKAIEDKLVDGLQDGTISGLAVLSFMEVEGVDFERLENAIVEANDADSMIELAKTYPEKVNAEKLLPAILVLPESCDGWLFQDLCFLAINFPDYREALLGRAVELAGDRAIVAFATFVPEYGTDKLIQMLMETVEDSNSSPFLLNVQNMTRKDILTESQYMTLMEFLVERGDTLMKTWVRNTLLEDQESGRLFKPEDTPGS